MAFIPVAEAKPVAAPLFKSPTNSAGHVVSYRPLERARDKEPIGFVWTTILGIVGAFVATWLGQAVGWYHFGEGAGLIGAVVGAVIVLVIYNFIAGQRTPNRM